MTEFMKPPGMALDSGPNVKGERRDVDVDNKARDGEIPSQRDPLGVQESVQRVEATHDYGRTTRSSRLQDSLRVSKRPSRDSAMKSFVRCKEKRP